MSSTEPTRIVCQPWAGIGDLDLYAPDRPTQVADDVYDSLLWKASELLYAFSGRIYSGPCESMVTVRRPPRRGDRNLLGAGYPYATAASLTGAVGWGVAWASREPVVAALPGRPVTGIVDATLDGEPLEVVVDSPEAGLIRRADGEDWPCDDSCEVTYTHGRLPDIGGVLACVMLTVEFAKAFKGQGGGGKLPKRIESLTREGVSYSFLNSFESLKDGRTGIYEVDAWLASVNPARMSSPPAVWSPDTATIRRKVRD